MDFPPVPCGFPYISCCALKPVVGCEVYSGDASRSSADVTATYIARSEITTLQHKAGDHAMEAGTLVSEALLAGAEGAEVLGCFGDDVVVEVKDNASGWAVGDSDVEVDLGAIGTCAGGFPPSGGLLSGSSRLVAAELGLHLIHESRHLEQCLSV